MRGRLSRNSGYTLIELSVVLALAGLILAIAVPQMLPSIMYGRLEGGARHLASYGKAAMAHAAMTQENLVIMVDLSPKDDKRQEYWTVRVVEESDKLQDEEDRLFTGGEFDDAPQTSGPENTQTFQERYLSMMEKGSSEEVLEQARLFQARFDRFAAASLRSRTKHVKHDGILSELEPLFEKEFTLDDEEDDKQDNEVKTALLERTPLPDGVIIESVKIGNTTVSGELIEIEVTPLGLFEPVEFYLKSEDDEYFTVAWDPITGGAHLIEGKQDAEEYE